MNESRHFQPLPERFQGLLGGFLTDPIKAALLTKQAIAVAEKTGSRDAAKLQRFYDRLVRASPAERIELLTLGERIDRIGDAPPPFIPDPNPNDPDGIDGIDTGDERIDGIDYSADHYIP